MSGEWERMHGPAAVAPYVTKLVARCAGCNTQWQVRGNPPINTSGCNFCGAPGSMIQVESEDPKMDSGFVVGLWYRIRL